MVHSTKTLTISEKFIEIDFKTPSNVLELLNANKISINQSCGGMGTCTTCRFFIRKNKEAFSKRTELGTERAEERSFHDLERLSCQTEVFDSAEIEIPI